MTLLLHYDLPAHLSEKSEGDVEMLSAEQPHKYEMNITHEQHMPAVRTPQEEHITFDDIQDRYRGLMLRTAYSIVKDRDSAEDAVQNALIQVWLHLPSLREMGALRPWMMRILVNQCISFKRRLTRSSAFLQQSYAEQETEQAFQEANYAEGILERNWDLAQAIAALPAKQQTVIALHYYQGMTLPEMSEKLRTSQNTLKKRLQAALSSLRQELINERATLSPGRS